MLLRICIWIIPFLVISQSGISQGLQARRPSAPPPENYSLPALQKPVYEVDLYLNRRIESVTSESFGRDIKQDSIFRQRTRSVDEIIGKQNVDIDSIAKKDTVQDRRILDIEAKTGAATNFINRLWVLIAAFLVFFMQAGFTALEVGMVRRVHGAGIGVKNVLDWSIICLIFFLGGFSFMFSYGGDHSAFWGGNLINELNGIDGIGIEFFLFQLAFAAAAATIVSGAISERLALIPYVIISLMIALLYPLLGSLAWGGAIPSILDELDPEFVNNWEPWLPFFPKAFHDFAGSTVVHLMGGSVALAGVIVTGPRLGRFSYENDVYKKLAPSNLGIAALGVFILWFCWWGFNGGSQFAYNDKVSLIILNTNLSAVVAGLVALVLALIEKKYAKPLGDRDIQEGKELIKKIRILVPKEEVNVFGKFMGGLLGGLVAITAGCDIVDPSWAMAIGLAAGFAHNLVYNLMINLKYDDPVGAIPVHAACGLLGTLLLVFHGDVSVGSQFLGVGIIGGIAFVVAVLVFWGIKEITGLRMSPKQEWEGYHL